MKIRIITKAEIPTKVKNALTRSTGSVLSLYAAATPALMRKLPAALKKDQEKFIKLITDLGVALNVAEQKGYKLNAAAKKVISNAKLKSMPKKLEAAKAASSKTLSTLQLPKSVESKISRIVALGSQDCPEYKRALKALVGETKSQPQSQKRAKPKPTKTILDSLTPRTKEAVSALLGQAKRTKQKVSLNDDGSVVVGGKVFAYNSRKNIWTTKIQGKTVTARDINAVLNQNKPTAKKVKALSETAIRKLFEAAKIPERIFSTFIQPGGKSPAMDLTIGQNVLAKIQTVAGANLKPQSSSVSIVAFPEKYGFTLKVRQTSKSIRIENVPNMKSTSSNKSFAEDIANLVESNEGHYTLPSAVFKKRLQRSSLTKAELIKHLSEYNVTLSVDESGEATFIHAPSMRNAMKGKKYSPKYR